MKRNYSGGCEPIGAMNRRFKVNDAGLRHIGRSRSLTKVRFHLRAIALVIAAMIGVWGCGGSSTSSSTPTPPPPLISVTVTPNSATVLPGATQSFAATVTGSTNTAVTWSVQENGGGTIDNTGLYTAPQDSTGKFYVVATSQANSAAKGTAVVTVPQAQLTISPAAVTLAPGGAQTFTASVAGFPNANVTWTVQETGGGVINSAGFYTAPSGVGFYHVVASVENTTLTASSTVTVTTSSSGFTPTGSMKEARGLHTATLLPDNKVLVAYGSNSNTNCYLGLSSIEVYDGGTGTFTEIVGEDGVGIFGHTATLLQNGQVLLAGGFVDDQWDCLGSYSSNMTSLYDSVTGVFSEPGNMTIARGGHTATLLMNGKVLVAGGADQYPGGTGSASAELYDPSTGAFTQTGSMAVARFRHTATLLRNGKVLITGGTSLDSSNPTATAEVYDPATGTFTVTGAMTTAREEHTATLLADGKVLIVGGEGPVMGSSELQPAATVEVYDPSTGLFSTTGSMTAARSLHTATLLPSGKVLVAGGGDDNSTAEVYDPATGYFSITGGMEIGRSGHTATLLPNGSVLVAGGGIFAGLASAELYQ
jgi:Bacterial Ig-like domain (group 2)/Galactose oxidase, central domain